MPQTSYNANYNPFNNYNSKHYFKQSSSAKNWEILYEQKHKIDDNYDNINEQQIFVNNNESGNFYRHKDKFLITSIKSGLMIIDCQRALERITYEKILLQLQQQKCAVQKVLFPDTLELTVDEKLLFDEMFNDLIALGFEFEHTDKNAFLITGIPSLLIETPSITELLHNIIAFVSENSIEKEIYEKIATQMAKNYAKCYVSKFNDEETDILANNLFQCSNPNFTTNGEKIIAIIADEEIFKKFIN
jgi:DNA mismatch repair protein MutL